MSVSAPALREIHRIHRQISDLRGRLNRGPRQVQAVEDHLKSLRQQCAAGKELLKQTRMSADDKQLQLRQREDRLKDLQTKLNGCSSNREYQTLKEQIAADEQANSVLSDEIFEALEAIDQQQAAMIQHDEECQKAATELESLTARVEEQQTLLNSELERVTQDLQQVESTLPADVRADYERIARVRGEDALAQVDGETCGGCYQMLTPQTINVLMMGKARFCSHCGVLLYLPEDTSPAS